jgi:hypothetical protein
VPESRPIPVIQRNPIPIGGSHLSPETALSHRIRRISMTSAQTLAMQKVEGSNPFSRFSRKPALFEAPVSF